MQVAGKAIFDRLGAFRGYQGVASDVTGRVHAEVASSVAGVAEPPGPDELKTMVDHVLRGIAVSDFADVLFRAAAFARVVATGRAVSDASSEEASRMQTLADQLERSAHQELAHQLG